MQYLPLVEIKHYSVSSADYAKAVVRITHKNDSRHDKALMASAIRSKLANNMEIVPGTFQMLSADSFSDTISGVLRVIRQSIPFVESQTRGFTSFASNMFMDTEKSIWVLKQTDNGKLLVQTSGLEDEASLNDLMASFSSTSSRFTPEFKSYSSATSAQASVIGGDLAYYVDKGGDARVGYVVAAVNEEGKEDKFMVLNHDSEMPEIIPSTLVLAKLDVETVPDTSVSTGNKIARDVITANTGSVALADMLSYYKLMFKRRPEYFAAFEQRLKQHAFL